MGRARTPGRIIFEGGFNMDVLCKALSEVLSTPEKKVTITATKKENNHDRRTEENA
jgi:hypothetical protein